MKIYSENFINDIYCTILNILAVRDERTINIIGSKRVSRTEVLSHFEEFQDSVIECILTVLSNKNDRIYSFGYIGGKNAGFYIKEFEKENSDSNEELSEDQKKTIQIVFNNLRSNDKIAIQLIAMLSGFELENKLNSVKKYIQSIVSNEWNIKGEYIVKK